MQCLQVALHLYERKSPPDMGEVGMNFSIRFQLNVPIFLHRS